MHSSGQKSGVVAGILLPMGLICLFAFCSLALALMGGSAYKSIQSSVDESFGSTVAASYLRTKMSQYNSIGAVSIRTEGDYQVLVLAAEEDNRQYETRIYVSEGKLMEIFVTADLPFDPKSGLTIAEVNRCNFTISEDGLFIAEVENTSGDVIRTVFALVQGGGE